jgi:hypothetical protein
MKAHALLFIPLLTAPALAAPAPQRPEDTPHVTLSRGALTVTVLLPDARSGYYRATRFDWSGLVARATFGGHAFYAPWKRTHDPINFEDALGTAEEFGTAGPDGKSGPPGFLDAKPGGRFVKIGVGVLEKPDAQPYLFSRAYPVIRAGTWTVRHGRDWIEFTQALAEGGWGYRYTKRLALTDRGFIISRRLQDTGSRPLVTDHYGHNFTLIDDDRIGPDYRVRFPFTVTTKQPLNGFAETSGKQIVFRKALQSGATDTGDQFYTQVTGFGASAGDHEFTIENSRTGAAVRVRGDRPLSRFGFYAAPLAVCPEPFVQLDLQPGQEARWKTEYMFLVPAGKSG